MTARLASLLALAFMLVVMVPLALLSNAESVEAHTPQTQGAITLPPLPTVTIKLPGATVTVKVPQEVETIILPPRTITLPPLPQETVTLPGETVTVTNNDSGPTATVTKSAPSGGRTETITAEPTPDAVGTRQDGTTGGTIEPSDNDDTSPIDLGDDKTTIVEAALGTLTVLLLVGLLLLALYSGYVLGYKDSEKADSDFMHALTRAIRRNSGE